MTSTPFTNTQDNRDYTYLFVFLDTKSSPAVSAGAPPFSLSASSLRQQHFASSRCLPSCASSSLKKTRPQSCSSSPSKLLQAPYSSLPQRTPPLCRSFRRRRGRGLTLPFLRGSSTWNLLRCFIDLTQSQDHRHSPLVNLLSPLLLYPPTLPVPITFDSRPILALLFLFQECLGSPQFCLPPHPHLRRSADLILILPLRFFIVVPSWHSFPLSSSFLYQCTFSFIPVTVLPPPPSLSSAFL